MKFTKATDQFDSYRVEMSYGQILALRDALKSSHASPQADEMLREIDWYLTDLPRPGERKDDEGDGALDTMAGGPPNGAPIGGNGGGIEDIDLDTELPMPDEGEGGGEPAAEVPAEDELETEPA
jgi:hypothetical protein